MATIIRDGYTKSKYLNANGEELRFSYRPMTLGQREQFYETLGKQSSSAAKSKITTETTVKHLVSWDAKLPDGTEPPINAENVGGLDAAILFRLFNVISGSDAGDDDPQTVTEASGEPESQLIQERTDAKN